MKIVLASNNQGKIQELRELLKHLSIDLISQAELGVQEIAETGLTFVENALIKARYAAQQTGLPALADDSGLVVDALNGAPGIYSARYAGDEASNIRKILLEMKEIPANQRQAHFHCVLAFMSQATDPTPLICQGKWSGIITYAPQGENGFGYDPIFYVPAHDKTAAELPLVIKNKISHRGIALQLLLTQLPEKIHENRFIC